MRGWGGLRFLVLLRLLWDYSTLHVYHVTDEEQGALIDSLLGLLVKSINSHKVSACGRDCVIQLLIRNITSSDGLNWSKRFLETDGM